MTVIDDPEPTSEQGNTFAILRDLTLFANLLDADVASFADAALLTIYKKGHILYGEGEKATFFYIVCSGWLKLYTTTAEGDEIVLAMLTRDSVTGEHALFEQGYYTSSAKVAEDAHILSIPLPLLNDQLRLDTRLAFNMLGSMVQYQRRHELQLEQYLLYSAPQRIGCFLLGLLPVSEHKNGAVLTLPYDKMLIASTLGMTAPTFSHALQILRDETGIAISGGKVTLASITRLVDFVNGCYSQTHLRGELHSRT